MMDTPFTFCMVGVKWGRTPTISVPPIHFRTSQRDQMSDLMQTFGEKRSPIAISGQRKYVLYSPNEGVSRSFNEALSRHWLLDT